MVNSLCWDLNGDYLASVSEESVKVWSLASGECIHELNSNGNQFHSCVFHPSYSALLVIGGMRVIILFPTTLSTPAPRYIFYLALRISLSVKVVTEKRIKRSPKYFCLCFCDLSN